MLQQWLEPLLRCAEGLYILEEESKQIVWLSPYLEESLSPEDCVGKPCWQVFLGRDTPCPFCPKLSEGDPVYPWEYFDPNAKRWMKVKHLLFRQDGVVYRAGNINRIDDMMRLNYETVSEIYDLKSTLADTRDEMDYLTHEVIHDKLTALYNRNAFQQDLEHHYAARRGLGVLYFDLNNLKEVNDRFRHLAGDELLQRMAKVLRQTAAEFRPARTYRIGGDEFVLLLSESTQETLQACAQRFQEHLTACNRDKPYPCSVAVGLAYSEDFCDPEVLVSKADHEMYLCKRRMKGLD